MAEARRDRGCGSRRAGLDLVTPMAPAAACGRQLVLKGQGLHFCLGPDSRG